MKKLFSLLLILFCCCFAGCSSDTEDSNEKHTDINLSVGDIVHFGRYEQDNKESNGKEPIKWQVLEIENGKALLTSCYILDAIQYCEYAGIYGDDTVENLPWHLSYIFNWLNNDFATNAFSDAEKKHIIDTTDYSSPESEIIGNVFLLSYDEILKYYNINNIRLKHTQGYEYDCYYSHELLCQPTLFAFEKDIDCEKLSQRRIDILVNDGLNCSSYPVGKSYSGYWTRTSLNFDSWFTATGHAVYVEYDGTISPDLAGFGNVKTKRNGVRPCVWVSLEDADKYISIVNNIDEPWLEKIVKVDSIEELDNQYKNDNIKWEVRDNTLYISGNGKMIDWKYDFYTSPWALEYFTKVVIEDGIENIGAYAFSRCEELLEIEIPKSVTSIGNYAFGECEKIKNIIIPDNVEIIGDYVFSSCDNLISVTLPKRLEMGKGTFQSCNSLERVNLPENLKIVGENMFSFCGSLKYIKIPDGVTSIEKFAFGYCDSLDKLIIPDSVSDIAEDAFYGTKFYENN